MKITIKEHPYFGHGTIAYHVYNISESLNSINYNKYDHCLVIDFNSCSTKLKLHIDDLIEIKIED